MRIFYVITMISLLFIHSFADAVITQSTITIAIVQLKTSDIGNFSKIRKLVKKAKTHEADLVIFPEESVFGWLNPQVFFEATLIPGKYSDEFASRKRLRAKI